MEDTNKRFLGKIYILSLEKDVITREITGCTLNWNGTTSKHKTKEQAIKALIKHLNNEINILRFHQENFLSQLSVYTAAYKEQKYEKRKRRKHIEELCYTLTDIFNLIKKYTKIKQDLKNGIEEEK